MSRLLVPPGVGERSGTTEFTMPIPIPSLNQLGARGNPRNFHRRKKQLQGTVESWLMSATHSRSGYHTGDRLPPRLCSVAASARLTFPTERRRDEGNYRAMLEKVLGDALVRGMWLADDTPERFRFDRVELVTTPGQGKTTTLVLDWRAD